MPPFDTDSPFFMDQQIDYILKIHKHIDEYWVSIKIDIGENVEILVGCYDKAICPGS